MEQVLVTTPVQGTAGTALYEAVDASGAPVPGSRLAVIGLMHGDEPVGDGALRQLAEHVEAELVRGSVLAVRANLAAHAAGLRHTADGTDLNRLWGRITLNRVLSMSTLIHQPYEERRVAELAPLLLACDAILDLHSTSRPTSPFVLMRDDQRHAAIARQLGVQHVVTGLHENAILSGGLASNVGLDTGERGTRLGFTFEAGQHADPTNTDRAWLVVWRLLYALGLWRTAPPPIETASDVYEVQDRFRQALTGTVPYRFVGYSGGEPGGGRRGPPRRLHSFEEVQADEVVLRRGRHTVVRAETPFTMLMPAPDTQPGTDLFYLTQPRHGGLADGVSRTDDEARREALAIERMLDLLADDGFARGSTWVGFDSRMLLDLCASVVGRTLRLPAGHPHRRIAVVGRGDAGGDWSERRAGQRYRQAMRSALAQGLTLDRIQLLRGAPLAWLDAVTSYGMLELMQKRKALLGHDRGVGMLVSIQQPHTVSLLAAGDLQRALETGDTRHVRVCLLVEAATVEPDGDTARVRVHRAGLVSARPEVLIAARGLIDALWQEHAYLVQHGSLSHDPRVQPLLRPDASIECPSDPDALVGLRAALYRAQLRLWCDSLTNNIRHAERIPHGPALGAWLARTMSETGILDADALTSLALVRDGDHWVADPDHIRSLAETLRPLELPVERAGLPGRFAERTARLPPSPPQPLQAADVDADDLERWVGWKRFVRSAQEIPDTRGKDLDVAFSGTDIRERLARWYDDVLLMGRDTPGDVMLVVAGDGSNPSRDASLGRRGALLRAHSALVRDPNVHYLRIQHAAGTHLSWMKDFLENLRERPEEGQSVAVQFEVEHGASVSVVLIATREEDALVTGPWSLDGWAIRRCAVVFSDLERHVGSDFDVGLFTEPVGPDQRVNPELLHFGRQHCEGLLKHPRWRVRGERGAPPAEHIDRYLTDQIAHWITWVRGWRDVSSTIPDDLGQRERWVARRLGLADHRLARVLAQEMNEDTPPHEAATALWRSVPRWPGRPGAGDARELV